MTGLALAGGILLLLVAVVSVVARIRLWGARLRAAAPSPVPPAESLVFASRSERGAYSELVPLLADWQLRGVLEVRKSGPSLAASSPTSAAPGPVWHFIAGPRLGAVDPVELIVLSAVLGGELRPGATVTVQREDVGWRTDVSAAIEAAVRAQRERFGTEKARARALRPLLAALSILSGLACLVGSFLSSNDTAALAWLSVGVPVVVALTVLVVLWPAKSPAERRYRQATRDLGEWVRTTSEPVPALGGWAMIWNLPGRWRDAVPAEVADLLHLDRSFVRGDFNRTIPEPFSLG